MLKLYNHISKQKEEFIPIDSSNVTMYVCGPTVYDNIHIGNARPLVVFDILFRILQVLYPKVTYVRNITDVDDKIIVRAEENKETISALTERTTKSFQISAKKINCLPPTQEPKATEYINTMQEIIQGLINKNHAYVVNNHVLFHIVSYKNYGLISGVNIETLLSGARVEVASFKKNPLDFTLWKPSNKESGEVGWDSPWGYGRPGWHIECSAMSSKILGDYFDIHGGGKDLMFPHHENEVAQSACFFNNCNSEKKTLAKYWLHNEFVMVDGQKMSKSLGNFLTLNEALDKHSGETIRLALLSTHYRQPLDFKTETLDSCNSILEKFNAIKNQYKDVSLVDVQYNNDFISALKDDLNTPKALTVLHSMASKINENKDSSQLPFLLSQFLKCTALLGILQQENSVELSLSVEEINNYIEQRIIAKTNKDFSTADNIRNFLQQNNILIEDTKEGTSWKIKKMSQQ